MRPTLTATIWPNAWYHQGGIRGELLGDKTLPQRIWVAPDHGGEAEVSVVVTDGNGGRTGTRVAILVTEPEPEPEPVTPVSALPFLDALWHALTR